MRPGAIAPGAHVATLPGVVYLVHVGGTIRAEDLIAQMQVALKALPQDTMRHLFPVVTFLPRLTTIGSVRRRDL